MSHGCKRCSGRSGYSPLTYFRSLPVDIPKIDQSFVRDMLDDPDDLGIVETMVQLARAFNRQVIAEGVETLEHGAVLTQLGCRLLKLLAVVIEKVAIDSAFPMSKEVGLNER